MSKKLTSGRLQDIEATIKIVKGKGILDKMILAMLYYPMRLFHNITKEQYIESLEFERKQEIEILEFYNKIKLKNDKMPKL